MSLFSTYKSSRFVSPTFLNGPVMRMRAFSEYWFQRAWNGSLMFFIPGDFRLWAAGVPFIYWIHRWHNDHTLETDAYEKALINRWGGSLEEARKNLSPQDQLRARGFVELEKLYSAYGPKDAIIQPLGSTLPGKDFYKKEGHGHH